MPYGLLSTGFNPKPQEVAREEINTEIRAARGASVDLSDGSVIGMLAGIVSEQIGEVWDATQAVYAAFDRDAATDDALDALGALLGSFRDPAQSSQVTVTLTGTPSTVIPTSSQAKTTSTGKVFQSITNVTITALTAWAPATVYVAGDRRTNNTRCYQCTVGGTSAGSGGPTTTATAITDNTVTWTYLGEGTGAIDVIMTSIEQDAIVAISRDLSTINTPVGGWSSVINLLDAEVGSLRQTDEEFRVAQEDQLTKAGTGTGDAIRAEVLNISGVTSCTVYENDTDAVDGNGQPPHSVQVVVVGGTDAAIAQVLHDNVAAGIATYGTSNAQVTDSQGNLITYYFTRPTSVNVYVTVTLKYLNTVATKGGYPTNGDTLVKQAIVTWAAANMGVGRDVIATSVAGAVFPIYVNTLLVAGVQGVLDIPRSGSLGGVLIGTAPGPTLDTTISITPFQIASFDTSRITVSSSAGTF